MRTLAVFLILCGAAYAQVSFQAVDPGITPAIDAWKALTGSWWGWGATALDYDGDGDSDIVLTNHNGAPAGVPTTIILRNNYDPQVGLSSLTFTDVTATAFPSYANLPSENKPHAWDVDNDGDIDLVCGSVGRTFINTGGVFTSNGQQIEGRERGTTIGDFNSDGLKDFSFVNKSYSQTTKHTAICGPNGVFAVTNAPLLSAAFQAALPATVQARLAASIAANNTTTQYNRYRGPGYIEQDINNDGLIDVLFWFDGSYSGDAWFYLCLRQPDDSLVEATAAAGLSTEGVRPLSAVDANGDGLADLLMTPGGIAKSGLWLQAVGGTFSNAANPGIADFLKNSAPYTPHEWWEDFDNDGDMDLGISKLRLGSGKVWENNGDGTFTERISASHWDADGMQIRSRAGVPCDFNGDGKTDVLTVGAVGHSSTAPVTLWINTSAGTPPPPPPPPPVGNLIIKVDGVEQPEGTTIKDNGVPVPPPTGPDDRVFEIETPEPMAASLPLPQHDPASANYQRWLTGIKAGLTAPYYAMGAAEQALAYKLTGDERHAAKAIEMAQAWVTKNTVAGNQYLSAAGQFRDVFGTLAWCKDKIPAETQAAWLAWGKGHLGSPDGSQPGLWIKTRYARERPYSNYQHSFLTATSYYSIVAQDREWLDWLKQDRFPWLRAYLDTTPGGGSSEGTGYGESHRALFELAKLWRDYDRTEILPESFAGDSILYWVHATCPGFAEIAPIGDHTRAHGRTDGYHRHLVLSALRLAGPDHPNASIARWYLANGPKIGQRFLYQYELADYHVGTQAPPSGLDHNATGVGHFFARSDWTPEANMLYVTCGRLEGDHAAQDQGGFGLWADGTWQTVTRNRWDRAGTLRTTPNQNVVLFRATTGGAVIPQKYGRTATLDLAAVGTCVRATCNLSPVYDAVSWERTLEWDRGKSVSIEDVFALEGSAEFQAHRPDGTERMAITSGARTVVQ